MAYQNLFFYYRSSEKFILVSPVVIIMPHLYPPPWFLAQAAGAGGMDGGPLGGPQLFDLPDS